MRDASFVVNGLALTDSGGLFIDIALGTAWIDGTYVNQSTNTLNQAVSASTTNWVFLEPDGDFEIRTTTTPTDPNALFLGQVATDGSSVTAIYHPP